MSLSADDAMIAAAYERQVKVYNTDTNTLLQTLDAETKFRPAFSPDAKRLATVADKTIVWDLETGRQLASLDAAGEPALSPDGKRLAATVGFGEWFEIWDIEANQIAVVLENDDRILVPGSATGVVARRRADRRFRPSLGGGKRQARAALAASQPGHHRRAGLVARRPMAGLPRPRRRHDDCRYRHRARRDDAPAMYAQTRS